MRTFACPWFRPTNQASVELSQASFSPRYQPWMILEVARWCQGIRPWSLTTWKWPPGKGDPFWTVSFFGFYLELFWGALNTSSKGCFIWTQSDVCFLLFFKGTLFFPFFRTPQKIQVCVDWVIVFLVIISLEWSKGASSVQVQHVGC